MNYEELNRRECRFVEEYVVDLVGSRAAIRAGYSKAGAQSQANRLLNRPRIKAAVEKRLSDLRRQTSATVDSILKGYIDIVDDPLSGRKDRLHALDSLARYLGMFIERQHIITDSPKVSLDLSNDAVREKALDLMEELRKRG